MVIEITGSHPAGTINPLWLKFHHLRRPERPTWEDAVGALRAAGVSPLVERQVRSDGQPHAGSFAEIVAWTRRRLCLSADRDAEVAEALSELGVDPARPDSRSLRPSELVVLWWDRG